MVTFLINLILGMIVLIGDVVTCDYGKRLQILLNYDGL